MIHTSTKYGRPLVYAGTPNNSKPVLTVENYPKWYGFQLVKPDGSVEEVSYEVLSELAKQLGMPPYVDHVPNAELVPTVAASHGWILDTCSYELMVGRWESAIINPRKYDF